MWKLAFKGLFVCACLLISPIGVFAQAVITEVMYDVSGTDTGREWIEVRNDGAGPLDLSQWKLFENAVAHKIVPVSDTSIPAGGYAIVADTPSKFLADNPGFSGLVFDSAFSLSSAGETVSLRNPDGQDVDTLSYLSEWGAAGDGFSLQRTATGSWISATPTVGSVTTASQSEEIPAEDPADESVDPSDEDTSNATTKPSAHESQAVENRLPDSIELEVTSGRTRFGLVGSPLEFEAKIRKAKGSTSTIEHRWSFGDGSSAYGPIVSHAYAFPGEYIVILNSRIAGTSAVSRISASIVEAQLTLSSVSAGRVEIENRGDWEANLGGMRLGYGKASLLIAHDTLVGPKSSIAIPFPGVMPGIGDEPVRLFDVGGRPLSELGPSFIDPYIELPEGMNAASLIESLKANFLMI